MYENLGFVPIAIWWPKPIIVVRAGRFPVLLIGVNNMRQLNLNYFTDPGHGWVSVKIDVLKTLGIADQISHYSYMRGSSAYLEED